MHFPVYLHLGPWSIHPHTFFEALAYTLGFRTYLAIRRTQGDVITRPQRWSMIAAAAAGGAIGSRVLFWCEDPWLTVAHWHEVSYLFSGKTIVGGLLGGLIAVELTKKILGIRVATGDLYAIPLCIAIAVGRIGCFLTGLSDNTFGVATGLPWGIDLGDGIFRHPVQIYEIGLLVGLAVAILRYSKSPHPTGHVFKLFLFAYLAIRLMLDFLKPEVHIVPGLSSIQLACVAGLVYYLPHLKRLWHSQLDTPVGG